MILFHFMYNIVLIFVYHDLSYIAYLFMDRYCPCRWYRRHRRTITHVPAGFNSTSLLTRLISANHSYVTSPCLFFEYTVLHLRNHAIQVSRSAPKRLPPPYLYTQYHASLKPRRLSLSLWSITVDDPTSRHSISYGDTGYHCIAYTMQFL